MGYEFSFPKIFRQVLVGYTMKLLFPNDSVHTENILTLDNPCTDLLGLQLETQIKHVFSTQRQTTVNLISDAGFNRTCFQTKSCSSSRHYCCHGVTDSNIVQSFSSSRLQCKYNFKFQVGST